MHVPTSTSSAIVETRFIFTVGRQRYIQYSCFPWNILLLIAQVHKWSLLSNIGCPNMTNHDARSNSCKGVGAMTWGAELGPHIPPSHATRPPLAPFHPAQHSRDPRQRRVALAMVTIWHSVALLINSNRYLLLGHFTGDCSPRNLKARPAGCGEHRPPDIQRRHPPWPCWNRIGPVLSEFPPP